MTLILETGAGVRGANAYAPATFVTTYLTDRGRATENGWSALSSAAKDEKVVAATDYVERRFGRRFSGSRLFSFAEIRARGSVAFSGIPLAAEILFLGDIPYKFVAALTGVANEVLIGASAAANASNLHAAITRATAGEGVTFGLGTEANRHVGATLDGATVELVASAPGVGGNSTVIFGPITGATITALAGGLDGGSQPLSFPRAGLFDRSGREVLGIPRPLMEAVSEYAVRAVLAPLMPDPAAGIGVKREQVGPIEVEYHDVATLGYSITPYPTADNLLADYLAPSGVTIRA